jgi:hypothetical protein
VKRRDVPYEHQPLSVGRSQHPVNEIVRERGFYRLIGWLGSGRGWKRHCKERAAEAERKLARP